MTPHVILLADAGGTIGWGHAVRQLALAEALVGRKVRTLFVTQTREALKLDWPCPVWWVEDIEKCELTYGAHLVFDFPDDVAEPEGAVYRQRVVFEDYGESRLGADLLVGCHFGAPVREPAIPAFLGPRWAPLRRVFRWGEPGAPRWNAAGSHGPPITHEPGSTAFRQSAEKMAALLSMAPYAIVPPSMIALECLAVGVPVVLHVPGPKWQPIADAMVAAGVAVTDSPEGIEAVLDPATAKRMSEAGREAVDGRGAERLAEWLSDA